MEKSQESTGHYVNHSHNTYSQKILFYLESDYPEETIDYTKP